MTRQAHAKGTVVGSCQGRGRDRGAAQDRGAALVITLLLLFLMSVMGLAAVLTSSSDMLINGYYRNFRGAFYAADSGLAIARQQLINQVVATVPGTFAVGTQPIPTTAAATALSSINSSYGNFTTLNPSGTNAASSWQGSFKILNNATFGLLASPAQPTVIANGFQYIYNYSLTAVGASQGSEQSTASESGSITITAIVTPAGGSTVSFAAFGMFIDQQPICSGSYLVPGLISGPVFTNGAWTFGTGGAYTFTDRVGQAGANAGFQFSNCYQSTAGSMTNSGTTISPTYQAGFQWHQNAVPLPANDFNQKYAVLDGIGDSDTCGGTTPCPSNATMNSKLKNISGTAYPSGGASSGVYLPYTSISGVNTVTGGGIMVQGDATVTLSTGNASGEPSNTQQIITIVNNGTTTTVTIDPQTNTTKVDSGSTHLTLAGVPTNCALVSPAPSVCTSTTVGSSPGTMVYVTGDITSITGPSGGPAVANGSQMTVTAGDDITITGDLKYVAEPVTLSANGGIPADTLVPANDTHQVLGLFTANGTGNIYLNYPTSNANHEIDASIAAISAGGSGGLVNNGNAVNTLTIVGGRIQSTIQNINSTTRNVLFDRRFSTGFAPPWFPSTTITPAGLSSAVLTPTVSRVQWVSTSSM